MVDTRVERTGAGELQVVSFTMVDTKVKIGSEDRKRRRAEVGSAMDDNRGKRTVEYG